ncbi:MAG: phosphoribosylamine--glycine ligase [Nanoarchaeota archaeon]
MTKVMIVDAGARGHALARTYLSSDSVDEVIVTPGNEGIERNLIERSNRRMENLSINKSSKLKDPDSILSVAQKHKPDLIEVAQDDALAVGTVDLLEKEGFRVFGPTRAAAQIEWDKVWSREFMTRHKIPTPEYKAFRSGDNAIKYALGLLERHKTVFFKAAGLYAGKGVVPAHDRETVEQALAAMKQMGPAGETFIVESGLVGEEFSYYAIVDGKNFLCFKSAQDNKRIWNKDQGPNTGGMGCNSPALVTKGLVSKIEQEIIAPAVKGLAEEGRPYKGILYLGGILCDDGSLNVVEFNSRWGDPECHVILPGIDKKAGHDYFCLVNAAIAGIINETMLKEDDVTRVCIVGASAGYPGKYEKGKRVWIDHNSLPKTAHLLSAAIHIKDGKMYTAGGRVFSVVGTGNDVIEARRNALQGMACCSIEDNGLHYRTDIAWRDAEREQVT